MMMQNMLAAGVYLQMKLKAFFMKEDGAVDIVAIVVLIGIAVLLALVFKDQLTKLLKDLFGTITDSATSAVSGGGAGD